MKDHTPDTFEKLLLEMDGDNVRAEIIFYLQTIDRAEQQKTLAEEQKLRAEKSKAKARQRLIHALLNSSGKIGKKD